MFTIDTLPVTERTADTGPAHTLVGQTAVAGGGALPVGNTVVARGAGPAGFTQTRVGLLTVSVLLITSLPAIDIFLAYLTFLIL